MRDPEQTAAPQLVAPTHCHTGENPLWNPFDERLYWCDIPRGCLYRYDPKRDHYELCYQGEAIGGFTVEQDGALLLFMARGGVRRWQNGVITTVIDELEEERESRFNDVIADPAGRVFCGTMPTPSRLGRLYQLNVDRTLRVMVEGVECSNGMAFSLDGSQMYYADSHKREITVFDYDRETGGLSGRRLFVRNEERDGLPDGLTMDAEGYLWSAQWDGWCLIRYRLDGTEDRRIPFPVKKVSSLTFGGPDCRDIYVTTAGGDAREENGAEAGALFRLNLEIPGVPENLSRIACG